MKTQRIQTTSLELSRKLKEAGFPQEAEFYYLDDGYGYRYQFNEVSFPALGLEKNDKVVFTFTAEEILERLPMQIRSNGFWGWQVDQWYDLFDQYENGKLLAERGKKWYYRVSYRYNSDFEQKGETLAEAAGKMWLYLKENHLLKEDSIEAKKEEV